MRIDRYEFDMETPIGVTGISRDDKLVDALTRVIRVEPGVEYHFDRGSQWDPYIGMGVGYYAIKPATNVPGNTATGGTYNMEISSPNTVGLGVTVGSSWRFSESWAAGLSAEYFQTFKDIHVRDTVSGREGDVSALGGVVLGLDLTYTF